MSKLQAVAAEASRFLYRDRERDKVLPKNDAPAWFTDLCRHAHGAMLPDDWRHEFIRDALSTLEDDGEAEDCRDLDTLYPYTRDRLDWLASHLDRAGYCDGAAADLGAAPKEILNFVALGMDAELREVFGLVRERLEEIAGERETGTDDETN